MQLKNSSNHTYFKQQHLGLQASLVGKAECFDGFFAGIEEYGEAGTSGFGSDGA